MNYNTKFKQDLHNKFKEKNINETSINLYLRNLEKLNDDEPLKNLKFLSPTSTIIDKLVNYKPNTYRGYLISICSSLHFETSKPMTKLYNEYYDLLIKINKELKEKEKDQEKTPTQKDNWMEWQEVKGVHENLEKEVNKFADAKEINQHKYNVLLEYVILSLYYYIAPKRNQDWTLMNVIYKEEPNLSAGNNYYDVSDEKFIFNKYKTSKTHGELTEKVPPELKSILETYFKFHPLIKGKKITKTTNVPLLVYYDGKDFSSVNSITRILNKVFGKKVGSSMLRHIYLSSKYGEVSKEMKEDAKNMGHSTAVQANTYIKN